MQFKEKSKKTPLYLQCFTPFWNLFNIIRVLLLINLSLKYYYDLS